MPPPIVQNEFQYRAIRTRITALDGHLRAIRDLHELAVTNRAQHKIEDEDDPPPLNWSTVYFSERRIKDGNETTQTRRDSLQVTAG